MCSRAVNKYNNRKSSIKPPLSEIFSDKMCDLSLRIIKNEFTEDIFNKELWPGVILFNSILAKSRLIVLQEASDL